MCLFNRSLHRLRGVCQQDAGVPLLQYLLTLKLQSSSFMGKIIVNCFLLKNCLIQAIEISARRPGFESLIFHDLKK
jgi:hypothetical protein